MEFHFGLCLTTYLDIVFGMIRRREEVLLFTQIGPLAISLSLRKL